MQRKIITLLALGLSLVSTAKETWSVGEVKVEGKTLVYKFMDALPEQALRDQMSWLTVVSWKYDGSDNNGMPPSEVNEAMRKLESGLESIADRGSLYLDVYTVTGNGLKEFVFYIVEREQFMSNFNEALQGHPTYPIEINFYEDKVWSDLKSLQSGFEQSANNE